MPDKYIQRHLGENWEGRPSWIIWSIVMTDQGTLIKPKMLFSSQEKSIADKDHHQPDKGLQQGWATFL